MGECVGPLRVGKLTKINCYRFSQSVMALTPALAAVSPLDLPIQISWVLLKPITLNSCLVGYLLQNTVEHSAAVGIVFSGNVWISTASTILPPKLLQCLCSDFCHLRHHKIDIFYLLTCSLTSQQPRSIARSLRREFVCLRLTLTLVSFWMSFNRTVSRHYTAWADETDITAILKCAAARAILFSWLVSTRQPNQGYFVFFIPFVAHCYFSGLFLWVLLQWPHGRHQDFCVRLQRGATLRT